MKAIIFDSDGTIADTRSMLVVLNAVMSEEFGRKPLSKNEIDELRKLTVPQALRKLHIPARLVPKLLVRAPQIMQQRISKLKPYNGMVEVINELSKIDGLILGILSSNTRGNVNTFLVNHKLKDKFNFVSTGVALFGKQVKIKQALRRHKIKPEDSLYVGDEVRDVEAAKKVPMRMIAVPWGLNHATLLKKSDPDYLINKPATITKIVKTQLL